jgi:hypothetical protein
MALSVWYEAGVSSTFEDISERVRKFTYDATENAEEGSVGISTMLIDDPDGDYDIQGWRRIQVYETDCPATDDFVGNFWVAERRIIRGPYRTGVSRQWEVSLADMNTVLGLRVFHQADASRPAETDVARITWMLGELGTPGIPEDEFFNTSGPVNMDAVDYRGQTRFDVITDCAQQSGKNFFVYTKQQDASNADLAIWYDFVESTAYSSTLSLSNDLADIDGVTTFEISLDTVLSRNPDRVYSGAFIQADGFTVYVEDAATSALFTRRDAIVPADNVKTQAKATARANRYLADANTEEDRITTSVVLPSAKVTAIKQGMRVSFKATHLPEYESAVWLRVMNRNVRHLSEDNYLVTLELTSGEIPAQPAAPPAPVVEMEGQFSVGSAAYGYGDRAEHFGDDIGLSYETLVNGKQYRLVGSTVACFDSPLGGYDSMSSYTLAFRKNGAAHDAMQNGDWDSNIWDWPPTDHGGTSEPGQEYTTAWVTYQGAGTSADIGITGQPLSGYWGFYWVVNLRLESRDAP